MKAENLKKWLIANNILMTIEDYIEETGAVVTDHLLRMDDEANRLIMSFTVDGDGQALTVFAPLCSRGAGRCTWPDDCSESPELGKIATLAEKTGCTIYHAFREPIMGRDGQIRDDKTLVSFSLVPRGVEAGLEYFESLDEPDPLAGEMAATLETLEGMRAYYDNFPAAGGLEYVRALDVAIAAVKASGAAEEVVQDE